MDLFKEIVSITESHNKMLFTGMKQGEQIGFGRVVDEINRLLDLKGLSGDWHSGYRQALMDVRAFLLAELKS